MRVAESREDGIAMDEDDTAATQIYTDGSGLDGQIGAAAVLYRNGRRIRSVRYWLGTDKEHTVPEAEAVALILGQELLCKECAVRCVLMAPDNVGAVKRSTTSRATPMQHIWAVFRKRWEMVRKQFKQIELTIR